MTPDATAPLDDLLSGQCHCGAVRMRLPQRPQTAVTCNCSICRRLGALWAFYPMGSVAFEGHPEATEDYVWGAKTIRTFRCRSCGCATHWEPISPDRGGTKLSVNLHNFDPSIAASVTVRRFDGADTWAYID